MSNVAHQQSVPGSLRGEVTGAPVNPKQIEFPLAVPVCAWCKPRKPSPVLSALVSHGICLKHLKSFRLELAGHTPVARRVRRANTMAEARLL
jgi:hypothetical protein